jgi:hypothetical protein
LTHCWSIQRHGLRAVRQLDTALSPVVSGSPKAGLETAGISGRKRLLEGFETTRRATIGNQHPRASQTRAPSAAARPGGVVTPCDPPSGLAFVSHGSHRETLRAPTGQYQNSRLDARLSPYKRRGAGLASGLPCHGCLHKYIPSLPAFIGSRVGTSHVHEQSVAYKPVTGSLAVQGGLGRKSRKMISLPMTLMRRFWEQGIAPQ